MAGAAGFLVFRQLNITMLDPDLGKFPHHHRQNASRSEASDIDWQTWGTGSNVEGISASIGQERRVPARAITGLEILTQQV